MDAYPTRGSRSEEAVTRSRHRRHKFGSASLVPSAATEHKSHRSIRSGIGSTALIVGRIYLAAGTLLRNASAATNLPSYYAHPAVADAHGVIAPWYRSLKMRQEVGVFKACVREFPGIRPRNGIIELRFASTPGHEAMIQAIELIPTHPTP